MRHFDSRWWLPYCCCVDMQHIVLLNKLNEIYISIYTFLIVIHGPVEGSYHIHAYSLNWSEKEFNIIKEYTLRIILIQYFYCKIFMFFRNADLYISDLIYCEPFLKSYVDKLCDEIVPNCSDSGQIGLALLLRDFVAAKNVYPFLWRLIWPKSAQFHRF